jgi:subtilisin family serine protease
MRSLRTCITLASHVKGTPSDAPRWAEQPRLRDRAALTAGSGTTVAVVDSGLSRHPWLFDGDNTPLDPAAAEIWDLSAPALPRHVGHGTFVAGVVRQYAPRAGLIGRRVIDMNGHADDADLAAALHSLVECDPDVVNLSLVPGDEPGETDEGTSRTLAAVRRLQEECGTVIVTAAGNDGDDFPTERLAPDDELTVVVGALDLGGQPAWFSNTRHVNIWAPGVDVLSTFIWWTGLLSATVHDDDHDHDHDAHTVLGLSAAPAEELPAPPIVPVAPFTGWARWNGTSFAAPAVAGAIAAEIGRLHHIGDPKRRRLTALRHVLGSTATIDADNDKRPVLAAKPIVLAGPTTA